MLTMTDRPEEIENRVFSRTFHTGLEVDMITIPERDYVYLKEQAERVEVLEKREEVRKRGDAANSKYYQNIEQQNKRYRELLTRPIMKDLIRLEDKGQFLPSDKREQFSNFKWDIKALESELDGS